MKLIKVIVVTLMVFVLVNCKDTRSGGQLEQALTLALAASYCEITPATDVSLSIPGTVTVTGTADYTTVETRVRAAFTNLVNGNPHESTLSGQSAELAALKAKIIAELTGIGFMASE